MKNLPDKFPFSYAIVAEKSHHNSEDNERYQFDVLLDHLKRQPLEKDGLDIKLSNLTIFNRHESTTLFRIPNSDKPTKINELKKAFESSSLDLDLLLTEGSGYKLSLISYEGLSDIPTFLYFKNHPNINIDEYEEERGKFARFDMEDRELYPLFVDVQAKDRSRDFEKINNMLDRGRALDDLYHIRNSRIIEIPYSDLWQSIGSSGIFSDQLERYKSAPEVNPELDSVNTTSIKVCICASWDQLFVEEILALYSKMNFCQNPFCGAALQFGRRGTYCLKGADSYKQCKLERDRNRKRKHGSQLKW